MQPEAVIFDIGNVLIEWQPERYFDGLIGPARRRTMFDTVDVHAMMVRIDAGALNGPHRSGICATAGATSRGRRSPVRSGCCGR